MIKSWLIIASTPFCEVEQYYCAFSNGNPLVKPDFPYSEIANELWCQYSYLLHLEDEFDADITEEEEQLIYDQAYENWENDCSFYSEEMSLEKLQGYIPGGSKSENDLPEIIYDER